MAKKGFQEITVEKPAWCKLDGDKYNFGVVFFPIEVNKATEE